MEREKYLEIYSRKIAAFIYAKAVLESISGNYIISFDDINSTFDCVKTISKDEELQEKIVGELMDYSGVAAVDYENCFDVVLYLDYVKNYECYNEEEE